MYLHKNLDVWKVSISLVTDIYRLSKKLPDHERYCLVSQIQRAAISIPANIAEGVARNSTKDYIRFLYISIGSCSELETLLIIITNIYAEDTLELQKAVINIIKMLRSLISALQRKLAG